MGGHNSKTNQPSPAPRAKPKQNPRPTPLSPDERLAKLALEVDKLETSVSEAYKITTTDSEATNRVCLRLNEAITQLLLKLDAVETVGLIDVRTRRKILINRCMNVSAMVDKLKPQVKSEDTQPQRNVEQDPNSEDANTK